mgnify:CR=1 FL=1
MWYQKARNILLITFPLVTSANADLNRDELFIPTESHFYSGPKLIWSDLDGLCSGVQDCKTQVLGAGLLVGYQVNKWFSVESNIEYLGEPDVKVDNVVQTNTRVLMGDIAGKFKLLNVNDHFQVYSTFGAAYQMLNTENSMDQVGYLASLGGEYNFNNQWSLRGELKHVDFFDEDRANPYGSDALLFSLGLVYRFGQKTTKTQVATTIKDVEKRVEAEVVEEVLVPAHFENIRSVQFFNHLFDYNTFYLLETTDIDALLPDLLQSEGMINVIGYTDSRGSRVYNQELSYKRANAIAQYIITQGVKENRLKVIGKGEDNPVATNMYEWGRKKNRRVEISFNKKTYK